MFETCVCCCFVVYAVQEVAVSYRSLQLLDGPMLWTFTTVHRAHGRPRSSVWRAVLLTLRHLLGTWPSSRGVGQVIAAFALCDGGFVLQLLCVDDACLRRVFVAALWCMRCRNLLSHIGHCSCWMVQCCGHLQQCIGHMVDCAAQCGSWSTCLDICWERGHFRGGLDRYLLFFALCDGGFVMDLLYVDDACSRRVFVAALWLCMRCRRLPSHECHCR